MPKTYFTKEFAWIAYESLLDIFLALPTATKKTYIDDFEDTRRFIEAAEKIAPDK